MSADPRHIVILPYFCEQEVTRYLMLAEKLKTFPQPVGGYRFLLASSPRTETNRQLIRAYSEIGEAIAFACPTQIFGYPEGPTAMFWDCMEYLAENFGDQPGFSLWLESDMAPIKPDWIDRLSREWFQSSVAPIMMGCYVPEVYKYRWFKRPKLLLHPHINGGACYALDFARHMPVDARMGVFDMAVFEYADRLGRAHHSSQIAFSTMQRIRRDLLDENKVLLHGFMQPKDQFMAACLAPLTEREKLAAGWNPWLDKLETWQRQVRVKFVRKGHRAMLENMFLAKQDHEQRVRTARSNAPHRAAS